MSMTVAIVDRGRGPQLSTSRITVQDLVPYFQGKRTYEQIREAMPILTVEDIQLVERYVAEHYEEVMEVDRRIRERNASRATPPEIEALGRRGHAKLEALRAQFALKKAGEGKPMRTSRDTLTDSYVDFNQARGTSFGRSWRFVI